MIKFSHSVFALPFAFTAAFMAAGEFFVTARQALWIAVAMVGARSGAMASNRIIDSKIDALNPRTSAREIASGKVGRAEAALFAAFGFFVLAVAAYMLNPLCFRLAPVAIVAIVAYSFTKRFTWASHLFLGVGISLAPLGAWIAVRGSFDPKILPLAAAVVFWLAGFDVLYALQDMDFDRKNRLFSIPAKFGVRRSLFISRVFHLLAVLMLGLTGALLQMGWAYWVGMLVVCLLFVYEHLLVKEDDLSRLNMAFFNMNGWISLTVFAFTALSYIL